ncbi:hypothetical protein, partial [Nocardioides litoris]|uniref:hypothetical protein n=1 Tax=Nocardioides litoris TaxID=1926648 RepID=UPI001477261A
GQYTWSSPRTYTSGGITFTNDRYSTNSLTSQNCGRPPAPTAPPLSAPTSLAIAPHTSRTVVTWAPVAGAENYLVTAPGLTVTVSATSFVDSRSLTWQARTYMVSARRGAELGPAATATLRAAWQAADRAYLSTKQGPALCGRAGVQDDQRLVCNVKTATGWTSTTTPRAGDWGYATDRAWITNDDGTVSYCARVGTGNQVRCDTFDGTTWSTSTSQPVDVAYPENRAYLSTKQGPALCGRAGVQDDQRLVCNVKTATGWTSTTTPRAGDWGYATDRAWITNDDGTVSYCARVGTGNQVRCDTFDGTTWS